MQVAYTAGDDDATERPLAIAPLAASMRRGVQCTLHTRRKERGGGRVGEQRRQTKKEQRAARTAIVVIISKQRWRAALASCSAWHRVPPRVGWGDPQTITIEQYSLEHNSAAAPASPLLSVSASAPQVATSAVCRSAAVLIVSAALG